MTDAVIDTGRVIVVGAGLGGLYAALSLAPLPVMLISPDPVGQGASSVWAQGGIAAAMSASDSPEAHAADTVMAGAGTVDLSVAASVTAAARGHILDLAALGTPFDRDPQGGYLLSREAAHGVARVVRVQGDQAGRAIMTSLIAELRRTSSVQVAEGLEAVGLDVSGGRVTGVRVAGVDGTSGPLVVRGVAVLLAGGGSGGLYALTTNPHVSGGK